MTVSSKTWFLLFVCALISVACWFHLSYADFAFVNLSVDKTQALDIARDFLKEQKSIDPQSFQHAAILSSPVAADRYLQKTIGVKQAIDFFNAHDIDMFFWSIRFFQEGQKEEFRVEVSSATGEVIGLRHVIEDTADRPIVDPKDAETLAQNFLKENFHFDFSQYTFKEQNVKKHDNRTDYSFSWNKTEVDIPWDSAPDSGSAKLLTSVTVSGEDILAFTKNTFSVPDGFSRFIAKNNQVGRVLSSIFTVLFYVIIVVATFFTVIKRNHLVMQRTKNFYIMIAAVLFVLSLLYTLNHFPYILFDYPTTAALPVHFFQIAMSVIMSAVFSCVIFIMPALVGESFHRQNFPQRPQGGFLHYLLSSFFSRQAAALIALGYLCAIIMLGIQAIALELGRQYCGVWTERMQIPQLSSSYLPFLVALTIGLRASFTEEITFRLFGINWMKSLTKHTVWGVILMSVIWGFGHTSYPIFPSWFRGLEVTVLGFFLSYIFLRYGIIPVIVAHYLFDAFWVSAAFLFGQARAFDTYTSLAILVLPLGLAALGFLLNRTDQERPLSYYLGKREHYNLSVLSSFLKDPNTWQGKTVDDIKKELLQYGWDAAVVEQALKNDPTHI